MRFDMKGVGKSWTIHIASSLITQDKRGKAVELRVTIESHDTPSRKPRHGWMQSFASARMPEEQLLSGAPRNAFDDHEWNW
jgi:hypothetical protein